MKNLTWAVFLSGLIMGGCSTPKNAAGTTAEYAPAKIEKPSQNTPAAAPKQQKAAEVQYTQ